MNPHMITQKQMQSILVMFWLGSSVMIGHVPGTGPDAWFSILSAVLMFLPLLFLYIRIIFLYPQKNLFEILTEVFGTIGGKIISAVVVIHAVLIAAIVLRTFSEFIRLLHMLDTPEIVIISFFVLFSCMSVKSGAENIGRMSRFCWPIFIVPFLIIFFMSLRNANLENLKPVMHTGLGVLLEGGVKITMVPLGEMLLCLSFFSSIDPKSVKITKTFLKSLALTGAVLLVVNLRNILVLGFPTVDLFYFPSFQTVSVLSLGTFFSRTGVIIGMAIILTGFIKICVCLQAASLGLAKILRMENHNSVVVPCSLVIVALSSILYRSTMDMMNWNSISPFFTIPVQIVLPVILWIGAEIRCRKKKPKEPKPTETQSAQA